MHRNWRKLFLATALALGLTPAAAGPRGPEVVGGSATVTGAGSSYVTVTQSTSRAIINWYTFDIGVGETTRFIQPGASAVILNRVTGGLGPSEILGTLTSNGRVFVINRDGVLFGPNAVVDTAGFLATTSDIKNSDFMAGRYNFTIPGRPDASIVNLGTITAHSSGFAALVAPGVRNSGIITADLGTVTLASGNRFTLDFYGDQLIKLAVGDTVAGRVRDVATGQTLRSLVTNEGRLRANGGRVVLTAAAARQVVDSVINNTGVIEANSVGRRGGTIILSAGTAASKPRGTPTQTVRVGGTLSAKAKKGKGGKVIVTGENIVVTAATIDVSGPSGGTVLIGGDWSGGRPDLSLVQNPSARLEPVPIPTATTVTVDAATRIDASATGNGAGGKVIVWSDDLTAFHGSIAARGGPSGGDGGFVEVSGHRTLAFDGTVDTRAPHGSAGTLLLDPADLYIDQIGGPPRPPGASVITNITIQNQLANGNVVVSTDNSANPVGQFGDIFVFGSISWSSASTLTLNAFRNITLDPAISITNSGAGSLVLRADSTGTGTGYVIPGAPGQINFASSTGTVQIFYNPIAGYAFPNYPYLYANYVTTNPGIPNQLTAYMLVNSAANLQDMSVTLSGNYALGRDIDAGTFGTFTPVGSTGSPFTGIFDGQGHVISNLTIAPTAPGIVDIGLFGATSSSAIIRNVALANVLVHANPAGGPGQYLGALVGWNEGTIVDASASGIVTAGTIDSVTAGGLVGQNLGLIDQSSAAVRVNVNGNLTTSGFNYGGGLAGFNDGTITNSYATGTVTGADFSFVGGLAGESDGTIRHSYATGNVTVTGGTVSASAAGGLVGFNDGLIEDSHATGIVRGTGDAAGAIASLGGLVGINDSDGVVKGSYATGNVLGGEFSLAGGLVGTNFNEIADSYATGDVTGASVTGFTGGLVGLNAGDITGSHATGNVKGSGFGVGGLVGTSLGSIADSYATGNVIGTGDTASAIGGLVGTNFGAIDGSYATGNVTGMGGGEIGGLVGFNGFQIPGQGPFGTITNSHATGTVRGGDNSLIGGLIGFNGGALTNVYALGPVIGGDGNFAGGLAGFNIGTVTKSYARGSVTVGNFSLAGGLIGANFGALELTFATGDVVAGRTSAVGGLVGVNITIPDTGLPIDYPGRITASYATGSVTVGAEGYAGGLIGQNNGRVTQTYSVGKVTGGSDSTLGGLIALNHIHVPTDFASYVQVVSVPTGNGTVTDSYWDMQASGQDTSDGGKGLTTQQLSANLPSGFDPALWNIHPGQSYPFLFDPAPSPVPGIPDNPVPPPVPPTPVTPEVPPFTPTLDFQQVHDFSSAGVSPPSTPAPLVTLVTTPHTGTRGARSTPSVPSSGPQWPKTGMPPLNETRFVSDEVVVQIGAGVPLEKLQKIAASLGLTILTSQNLGVIGTTMYRFKIPSGKSVREIIAALERNKVATFVQPNYTFVLAQAEQKPQSLESDQYVIEQLHLKEAHQLATGKNVLVAVIDSEIDAQHPDIAGTIAARFEGDTAAEKPHPHGTGMAGAIVSHKKLMGIAPGARVLAVRAFGTQANTAQGTTFEILRGLDWAANHGARIVNMSFAGPKDPSLQKAFKSAYDKNIILIAAAGNAGPKSPPLYPGADPSVIAVTAVDVDEKSYVNANRGSYIAVAAPGVDVLVPAPGDQYQLTTGTSVASAEVSGIVALLLERDSSLDPKSVRKILTSTAKSLNPKGRDNEFGYGLVDPYKALMSVQPKAADLSGPKQ